MNKCITRHPRLARRRKLATARKGGELVTECDPPPQENPIQLSPTLCIDHHQTSSPIIGCGGSKKRQLSEGVVQQHGSTHVASIERPSSITAGSYTPRSAAFSCCHRIFSFWDTWRCHRRDRISVSVSSVATARVRFPSILEKERAHFLRGQFHL